MRTETNPLRVLVVAPYYPPEPGAASTRLGEMTRFWAEAGAQVTVVAGKPCYPDGVIPAEYEGSWVREEVRDGVRVIRGHVWALPNHSAAQRFLHQASHFVATAWLAGRRAPEVDVVLGSSPHLFGAAAAALLARRLGVPFALELRDLWPRIIWQTGAVARHHPVIRMLEVLERWLYRRADRLITVTKRFRGEICEVAPHWTPEAIEVIPNGVDTARFVEERDPAAIRRRFGLDPERPLVLYAGVHGIPQGLEVVVDAARQRPDVQWALLGKGGRRDALMAYGEGVPNLRFLDAVGPDEMPDVYAMATALVVPLRDLPSLRSTIPSKVFEIWASGRPVLLSAAGEVAELAEASGASVVVPPEDPAALAAAADVVWEPDRCAEMGARGREFVMAHYERRALALRYLALLGQQGSVTDR